MTLMELLVAVALSSLVIVALNFITQSMFSARRDIESFETEKELFRAEFLIRNVLSTAVDVRMVTGNQPTGSQRGWVNTNFNGTPGDQVRAVGVFRREVRAFRHPQVTTPSAPGTAPDPTTSDHALAGLFYIPPSANVATRTYKSGIVFIDQGNNGTNVQPDYGDEIVSNLVSFRTFDGKSNVNSEGNQALTSFNVEMVYRRFLSTSMKLPKCYLPTGCGQNYGNPDDPAATEIFVDVRRIFRVLLMNTDMGPSPFAAMVGAAPKISVRERTLGRVYFFRMLSPRSLEGN